MNPEQTLPLFIAIPLGAAFLIQILGMFWKRAGEVLGILAAAVLVYLAWSHIGNGITIYTVGGWRPPFGIALVEDGLSAFFHLVVSAVALLVVIYSTVYMKRYTAGIRYYSLLMLMLAGMNGVIATGDLFNMFVFLEIASIASYALVAFGVDRDELEASFKYLVLGSMGSSFILFGIVLTYNMTGTLNLADIGNTVSSMEWGYMLHFISALFLAGFGIKTALMPFHAWLPDAHPSAPAPISAMLSGLIIKGLGVYCIVRLFFNVFGFGGMFSTILITLGLVSMLGGVLLAIGQNDFKRLLAYSSISQVGYIVFAIGLGTPLGLLGGLFHLLNHAFFKSLLFLSSGAVEYATGTRDLRELGGLWRSMPVTSAACSVASLSISAVPPFGGFFSKLIIIVAAVQAADVIGPVAYSLAGLVVFISFLTLLTFVKVQKSILFGELPDKLAGVREVPAVMWGVLVVLAVFCTLFGLASPWVIAYLIEPARTVLLDNGLYIARIVELF